MLVAELMTAEGHSVPDGTEVVFDVSHAEGREVLKAQSLAGLATAWLDAPRRTGQVEILARSGQVESEPRQLRVEPGPLRPFTLSLSHCTAQRICRLSTSPLADAWGNTAVTGLSGLMVLSGRDGPISQMRVEVLDGRVNSELSVPPVAGPITVMLSLAGQQARLSIDGAALGGVS